MNFRITNNKEPVSFNRSLAIKIISIMAPVFILFFLSVGYITERMLEQQIISNTDEILGSLVNNECEEINQHFKMLEDLGYNSANTIVEWMNSKPILEPAELNKKIIFSEGALRTNVKAYSNQDISGFFLSSLGQFNEQVRKTISATEGRFEEYAKGTQTFVFNMYLITKNQFIRIYKKDWALEIEGDHNFNNDVFYNIATPENNPEKKAKWTKPYYDSIWKHWMTSLITPIYIEDEFFGIVGHDVFLDDIYAGVVKDKYFKSGYGFIFNSNKNLIVHPDYLNRLTETAMMGTELNINEFGDSVLTRAISELVDKSTDKQAAYNYSYKNENAEYFIYSAKLQFLDWHYAIQVPKTELIESVKEFRQQFIIGGIIASSVLFVFVVLIIWISVIKPISKLKIATDKIVEGDLTRTVEVKSRDEIGKLSASFNEMIFQINQKIEQIKAAEKKYQKIFDNAVEGIFQSTIEGKFLAVNPSAARILGYNSPQELMDSIHNIGEQLYVEAVQRKEFIESFNESNSVGGLELRTYKKDGSIIWISFNVRCVRDSLGHITLFEGFFDEITHRKEAEEKLKFSNTIMRAQQETSPDGILIVDKDERIIDYNNKFLDLWRIPDEIMTTDADAVVRSYVKNKLLDPEKFIEKIIYLYGHPTEKSYDEIAFKDGTIIERFSSPLISPEGTIYGRIWYFKNITETQKARQALLESKERAELSDKLKSEFLAQVSHEIRTPINAILSFSHLIKDELEDKVDEDLKDGFKTINRAGRRIIRTIDLILNMSEIQSGTYDYVSKPLDIYEDVILNCLGEYRHLAKESKLTLSLKMNTDNHIILADEYTVTQIIQNLLDNAIKYTLKGGIEIIVDRNENEELTVSVRDTGIGISEEYLPNLFTAFSQEEQGYTRKFEGNGLGLALVKNYCELNNAKISVESIKNVGTTFTVLFLN